MLFGVIQRSWQKKWVALKAFQVALKVSEVALSADDLSNLDLRATWDALGALKL
jgi:hypothetical protein